MATFCWFGAQDKAVGVAILLVVFSINFLSLGDCARVRRSMAAKSTASTVGPNTASDTNRQVELNVSSKIDLDVEAKELSTKEFCSPDNDPPLRRVVWYGGTFDPPTVAHMHVAEVGLEQDGVHCVWFSPLYHPLYKPEKSDVRLREEMILKSLGEDSDSMAVVRAFELSYKPGNLVQRMQYQAYLFLAATYKNTKFDMVVGADAVTPQGSYTVEGWRDILREIARDENHIFVMDRDVKGANIREYEEMLVTTWDVSPSPYVNVVVDMDRFSHVSSSGIRKLLLDAPDGRIDAQLKEWLNGAGLSDVLVEYLQDHPEIVEQYNRRSSTTVTTTTTG